MIRESAVAAAKARLKLARQKHMELTGTGKEISPEPPGHTEGVASLRADALRIAAKSRAPRAAAKSHARKDADGKVDASKSLGSANGLRASGSPLRRRTALKAATDDNDPPKTIMSPASLERFQADQQEKAKARIRERKLQMEDEGRKQAEADEAARSMTKTHHLEVQEAKAQRRAELYRLNVILRRREGQTYERYMARMAGSPPVTSGPAEKKASKARKPEVASW